MMCFFIKICRFLSVFRQGQDCLQHPVHAGVYRLFGQLAVLYGLYDLSRGIHSRRRHLQIGSCSNALDMIVGSAPVCDDDAVISPLVTENVLQQMGILV